jgi:hypothetical protein
MRFMALDPIRDGTNWYMYAGNNPTRYTDPLGLKPAVDDYFDEVYGGNTRGIVIPPRARGIYGPNQTPIAPAEQWVLYPGVYSDGITTIRDGINSYTLMPRKLAFEKAKNYITGNFKGMRTKVFSTTKYLLGQIIGIIKSAITFPLAKHHNGGAAN